MSEATWNVQIGESDDPTTESVPPVPTTVYQGDEEGARTAYADQTSTASDRNLRYVMLRNVGEVVECWGTPPAVA